MINNTELQDYLMPFLFEPYLSQIAAFCQRHRIRSLSLFGSGLTEAFHSDSDIDLLIEFSAGTSLGFFKLIALELELTDLLERKVDLRTPQDLSRYFRNEVLQTAKPLYESP